LELGPPCYSQSRQGKVNENQNACSFAAGVCCCVSVRVRAPPVYPGAKAVDELNAASKKGGQNAMAYNTFDPFEKVYDFYKTKDTEVQSHRPPRASEKYAAFRFPDTGYTVVLSWKESTKSNGTIIHMGSAPTGR
jgi:hypothetical protein